MISRLLASVLKNSPKSILLLGPRQVGKSSLINQLRPDLTINLAREEEFLRHSAQPDLLESLIKGQKPSTVFIDEIQRLPSLLNTIQDLIDNPARLVSDRQKPIKFYLTGSSARKLRRGEANLLPGRIFTYQLGGLCARELDYKVDLERALHAGLLPEPYLESSREFREKLL
jgi:predicted AAA+ superfamily ATPase